MTGEGWGRDTGAAETSDLGQEAPKSPRVSTLQRRSVQDGYRHLVIAVAPWPLKAPYHYSVSLPSLSP